MASSLENDLDAELLRRALELAERGRGRVSPNPLVGAVIVRDGELLGEGHHAELGGVHAEVAALADCRERGHEPGGATMHVTLEPCAHRGRQPPCTEAILAAGVARVVIGADDPTPKASGRGPQILRDEGVDVRWAAGPEAGAARLQNQAFRKHARTGRPRVVLKSALSLDGYTATRSGDSRWISGAESRALVHRWRAEADAVAVGIGTALADDPLLTARDVAAVGAGAPRQPLRMVFDSSARLAPDSQLVRTAREVAVLVVVDAQAAPAERTAALREAGVEVLETSGDRVERLRAALDEIGRREVTSLLLEGGAELAGAFLDAREVDELGLFLAPVMLGSGRPLAARAGVEGVAEAERALAIDWERCGPDLLARARLKEW
ncbi:MAG: bifunctional diaminohydroxyphosphoribosylaminopyrimidine deaminase/5-amino-6-(5-phosphoribosylamino)uracil reductase RibD [Solirubrobacterales bacterium]|nr:bifunctional diaminohydroxyphosphoribosylaminopyrimidine deaminase/5-amino-6-(5-phosphoribosylamino)uracil reductase RibD [Solirubrobacterales bacterium]